MTWVVVGSLLLIGVWCVTVDCAGDCCMVLTTVKDESRVTNDLHKIVGYMPVCNF